MPCHLPAALTARLPPLSKDCRCLLAGKTANHPQQPSAASAWRRRRSWAAPASRSGCDKRASTPSAQHPNACAATDQRVAGVRSYHPPLPAGRIVGPRPRGVGRASWIRARGGRVGGSGGNVCLRGEENRRVRGRVGCARARRVRVGGARRAGVTRTRRRVRHPAEGGQSPLARPPVQPAPRSVTASGAETPTHPYGPRAPGPRSAPPPRPTDPRSGEARRVRHARCAIRSLT